MSNFLDQLLVFPQRVAPQRTLSQAVRWITRREWPALVPGAIRTFCRFYEVDLAEALEPNPARYASFNAFFSRALRDGARPVDPDPRAIVSPADGKVSQAGRIEHGQLLQAKGRYFSLEALLASSPSAASVFEGGQYAVVYLSPRDYHRVHAPLAFSIEEISFVPGQLFSVNERTARAVDGLYALNERVVLSGHCAYGPCAVVLVGAMLVSSMNVNGFDLESLERGAQRPVRERLAAPLQRAAGEEIGRFNMGSTVAVILPPGTPNWVAGLGEGSVVRMGQRISQA